MPSLLPLSGVLGKGRAAHLLRRATFQVTPARIDQFAQMTAEEAVNQLLTFPDFTLPNGPISWVTGNSWFTDYNDHGLTPTEQYWALMGWVLHELKEDNSARSKLMIFLHTCFTASIQNYFYPYYHYRLLWLYAAGNLKDFARKFSVDNMTLEFLNGRLSTKEAPNEDYAREFLELFTIQKGTQAGAEDYTTYTEQDVLEAARIFTGFHQESGIIDPDTLLPTGRPDISDHDSGDKVFSHRFDNHRITGAKTSETMMQEVESFVDMVFNKEATATSFVTRMYRFFVKEEITEEVNTSIIAPLANLLLSNGYELEPVLKELLKSQHFYDADDDNALDNIRGAKIKSPLDLSLEALNFFNVSVPDPLHDTENCFKTFYGQGLIFRFLYRVHMPPFDPPSVKGYDAYTEDPSYSKYWFSSDTIGLRYNFGQSLMNSRLIYNEGSIAWPTSMDLPAFFAANCSNPTDSSTLVNELLEYMLPYLPAADRIQQYVDLLLGGLGEQNWIDEWNAYQQSGDGSGVEPAPMSW